MRIATYLTLLAAPLALAACDSSQEPAENADMPMAQTMPDAAQTSMGDMPMMDSATAGKTGSGEGTVTAISETDGKITIEHGAIPAVGWPAMTMGFRADEAMRKKVAEGDKVSFEFHTTEGSGGELTAIEKE